MKKAFRTIGLALLGSLIFGLVIGSLIDRRAQRPVIYMGLHNMGLHDFGLQDFGLQDFGLQDKDLQKRDQEFLRAVQGRSTNPERLFSTRASTKSRSDKRFT